MASQQGSLPLSEGDAFELELRELQPEEAIVAPTATLCVPTVASANDNSTVGQLGAAGFDTRFAYNSDDIIWARLPGYHTALVGHLNMMSARYYHLVRACYCD